MRNTVSMPDQKILLIIPELTMGGAQNSFSRLAMALSEKYEVVTVVFDHGTPIFYDLPGKVLTLSEKPDKTVFSKLITFYKRWKKLRSIKKQINPTASISFLEGADYLNILSKRHEKVIISIRGSKWFDPNLRSYLFFLRAKLLMPLLYRRADQIACVNNGIAHELAVFFSIPKKKLKVIGNYLTLDMFHADEEMSQLDETLKSFPYFLYFGRLAPEKGLSDLVRVFSLVKREKPQLKLLIVGDGPEKGSLVHLVHKLGLSSGDHAQADVWFTGAINRITPYIRFATASLMNSVSEGFPNSMIESLFYKTPVISADCPYGPREIFEAGEGRVLDKIYPVKTGGGVLLQNVNTSSEEMWKNVLLDFVNKKFPVENTFYERLILSVSKDNVIDKWQSIIK